MNSLQKIEASPQRISLLEELRQQVAKDLNLETKEIPKVQLLPWLETWLDKNLGKLDLASLLYRIDLQEKAHPDSHSLAKAILEREAQKVIFRAQYSGKF